MKQVQLTSAELAQLWTQYLNDSGSICFLTFFAEKAEDEEIKPLIDFSLKISKHHIEKITEIFKDENHVVPHGFTLVEDVNLQAPKLFSDTYVLNFLFQMAKIGITTYANSVTSSTRPDITKYYMDCLSETMELYNRSKELMLSKGLLIRAPYLPNISEVDYVEKQSFIFDVFGDKRPLIASEVGNLFSNIQRNALGDATLAGFSQVAESEAVTEFFLKGKAMAVKHVRLFGEKLEECDLPVPSTWVAETTISTEKTFSDKLMMFFTCGMIGLGIGLYGAAISQSLRADLVLMYNRLSVEVQLYSEDGANILIKNGWMEKPPMAAARSELARKNNK